MENVVVSMGGSIVAPDNLDPAHIRELAELFLRVSKKVKLYLIVGGGKTARRYIETAKSFTDEVAMLDLVGIAATRINAQLLITALGRNAFTLVPASTAEAVGLGMKSERIVVMGGTTPGHSTDHVGAELSALTSARFINATNVDYIYTADPKKNPDAKKLESLTIDELIEINGTTEWKSAGANTVIDGPACEIIREHSIPTFVVNGADLESLENVITGKPFRGTTITA